MRTCGFCGYENDDAAEKCVGCEQWFGNQGSPNGSIYDLRETQKTAQGFHVEGIGALELNSVATLCASLFRVLSILSLGIVGIFGLAVWMIGQRGKEVPSPVSAIALFSLLGAFAFFGLWYLATRLYYPGDWYKMLERCGAAENHSDAKDAAHALLKLKGTDLPTNKLKAKAHLYLAYYLPSDSGAGHWGALIKLLDEILEQEPDNAVFRLDRAQAYQHVKNYDEALRDLEVLFAGTNRGTVRALSLRISCLTSTHNVDEARSAITDLEKLIPRFPTENEREAARAAVLAHRTELSQL